MIRSPISPSATEPTPPSLPGFGNIRRYWNQAYGGHTAKILPGEYYVTGHDEWIETVLGSCVAACIRDRVFGLGGMNHFMLPSGEQRSVSAKASLNEACRYGNYAMEHLINDILKHGGNRKNLEIKLFGGSAIIEGMSDIGQKNIRFVKDYIRTETLAASAEDLGGKHPRKVVFQPRSGRVFVKHLATLSSSTTVAQQEAAYLDHLDHDPVEGDIELF